jgi:hypothetical protein
LIEAAICCGESAFIVIESNDSDGSRGVDLDLRKKDFERAGGTSICDAAGGGTSNEGGGVSELDDAGGGGVSDEEGERKGASV